MVKHPTFHVACRDRRQVKLELVLILRMDPDVSAQPCGFCRCLGLCHLVHTPKDNSATTVLWLFGGRTFIDATAVRDFSAQPRAF